MSDTIDLEEIRRQLQARLLSLRSAGVEWLPAGSPREMTFDFSASEPAPQIAKSPYEKPLSTGTPRERGAPRADSKEQATREVPSLPVVESKPTSAGSMTLAQRQAALDQLAQEVKRCVKCKQLASTRTQTVFADGKAGADLCFIGEAPGADEDKQGIPFVGASGQLLDKMITACGLKREDVYICNIIKCRPPGNRNPLPDEANNCRDFLDRQLALVQPKYICALGAIAAQNLLKTTTPVGKLRGQLHDYHGIPVMVTYHPSYLLRSPEMKGYAWDDLKMLLAKMGRAVPGRAKER